MAAFVPESVCAVSEDVNEVLDMKEYFKDAASQKKKNSTYNQLTNSKCEDVAPALVLSL